MANADTIRQKERRRVIRKSYQMGAEDEPKREERKKTW